MSVFEELGQGELVVLIAGPLACVSVRVTEIVSPEGGKVHDEDRSRALVSSWP